jgi:RNA polymerase sigma-70 factor (ECF subfamily)
MVDPYVVLRADQAAVESGATKEMRGSAAIAQRFFGRAQGAQVALLDGSVGLMWAPGGRPRVAFALTIMDGRIAEIELTADRERLDELDWVILDD